MTHGGKRVGSGRKTGSAEIKTRAIAERIIAEGKTPLEIMLKNMREADLEGNRAMALEAAKSAAPYIHPRLSAVEVGNKDGEAFKHKIEVSWMTETEAKNRGWA